jgi:hypothetical protein
MKATKVVRRALQCGLVGMFLTVVGISLKDLITPGIGNILETKYDGFWPSITICSLSYGYIDPVNNKLVRGQNYTFTDVNTTLISLKSYLTANIANAQSG